MRSRYGKSFWTCSGTADRRRPAAGLLLLAALAALTLASLACGSAPARRNYADLTNPFLGPEYAQWLIGPVSGLATQDEVAAYLALRSDDAAKTFIGDFWQRRNPRPAEGESGNRVLQAFLARGEEADRLYAEGGFQGRRTARGTIYVLFGPAKKVDYEVSERPGEAPVEAWTYDPAATVGLHGRPPAGLYRFIKQGDLTVFYTANLSRKPRRDLREP
jgi:GWxTD domain-containing protein